VYLGKRTPAPPPFEGLARVVRSPDFRVILLRALPRHGLTPRTQWICSDSSPVTVAGAVPVFHRLPVCCTALGRREAQQRPRACGEDPAFFAEPAHES
jgi:hypothetical protein